MFDKNEFANILKKILEEYNNQNEFARNANIGRAYISRILNMHLDTPPKPSTLQGIADASKGISTYNELMQICGYIPKNATRNLQSLDIQLSESIFNTHISLLNKYDLSDNDILELKKILIERDNTQSSIENQLNNFAMYHSANAKELFASLIQINDEIENALINLHKNGYLYPIPVYRNTKNIDLLLVSDIVDYVNFSVPSFEEPNNYFALQISDDKMYPLLDVQDIAIIYKTNERINGQIVAAYSITKECCIIGKIFEYENIIELSYFNGKSEKFITNDLTILGKVIKAENQSAFK